MLVPFHTKIVGVLRCAYRRSRSDAATLQKLPLIFNKIAWWTAAFASRLPKLLSMKPRKRGE